MLIGWLVQTKGMSHLSVEEIFGLQLVSPPHLLPPLHIFELDYNINLVCQIYPNTNHVCYYGYNWHHNYHPFCVRVALIINITRQPVYICIWRRYPHLGTSSVWIFGSRPRLDIFQVQVLRPSLSSPKQNSVITSIEEPEGSQNLCFTSTSLRSLCCLCCYLFCPIWPLRWSS